MRIRKSKNKRRKSAIFAHARRSGSLALPVLRAYSSAWLERFPDKEEVSGSSPLRPTISTLFFAAIWGLSSIGRAPALQAGG